MEAPRQSVDYCRDCGAGRLHGGARHLHRQRGAAPHRRLAGRFDRPGHLGADQLPGLECDRAAHRRVGLERDGPAQFLRPVHCDLHRLQLSLRRGALADPAAALSRFAGRRRRRNAAHGPGHHGRQLRAAEARPGLCSLRTGRRARAFHRPHAGRLDHRQLHLALDLLHQHSGGHSGLHSRHPAGGRSAVDQGRPLAPAPDRLPGAELSRHRHGRPADHARQGRGERLVLLRLHPLLRLPLCRRHRGADLVGVAAQESDHQYQALPLQELRHLLLPDGAGGRRAQRQHRPAAAVHAATAGLERDHRRPGADRGRRDAASS